MDCPHCGNPLRPSKKSTDYELCDTCKKKIYLNPPVPETQKKKSPKGWIVALAIFLIVLVIAPFVFLYGYTDGNLHQTLTIAKDTITMSGENNLFKNNPFGSIEITFPAYLISDSKETVSNIIDESGIRNVKENKDGSVTLKLSKKAHIQLVSGFESLIDDGINEAVSSVASFDSVEYNKNMTEFTVKIDSSLYGLGFDKLYAMQFFIYGDVYQILNAVPEKELKTVVNFVDENNKAIESLDSTELHDFDNTEE